MIHVSTSGQKFISRMPIDSCLQHKDANDHSKWTANVQKIILIHGKYHGKAEQKEQNAKQKVQKEDWWATKNVIQYKKRE